MDLHALQPRCQPSIQWGQRASHRPIRQEGTMKVGVTGAAGFIGSHLCSRLLAEGDEVVAIDDLSMGSLANLGRSLNDPRLTFEKIDCTRRRDLRAAFDGCEAIIHLAA